MFIFKRNQIIITALVFMVGIAAYLNFTDNKNSVQPTFEDDTQKLAKTEDDIYDDFFPTYEFEDIDTLAPDLDDMANAQSILEDDLEMDSQEVSQEAKMKLENKEAQNESVLVNKSYDVNYFVEAKMDREQKRSEQIEILSECINNNTLDKDARANAAGNLISIQERIEKESSVESLIKAKGFKEVFVRINDEDVDVVINKEKIEDEDIAQIEDIVRRKTGYATSQIRISPLKSK